MSRPTMQRSLTLTEELEKLEQSITLTLQQIDQNFSQAQSIVTSSILPVVEEYAKHSADVWEASKFWKQFFEASANVSLSGYEEASEVEVTQTDTNESLHTPTDRDDSTLTGADVQHGGQDDSEEFSVDSPTQMTGVQTTPKLPPSTARRRDAGRGQGSARSAASFRSPSPRKYTGKNPLATETSSDQPSTPRINPIAHMQSSPFHPESAFQPSAFRRPQNTNNDPLMHRVLDKNYRVQATPHTQRRAHIPQSQATTKATPATVTKKALWDDSPQSSPEIAAPQLRSDLFSPAKAKPFTVPRTPGVSVLTPATRRTGAAAPKTSTGMRLFSPQDKTHASTKDLNRTRMSHQFEDSDEDSDDDGFGGMSPPKTMQFHVPQSRLLQTPAREASRKIVEDLLLTAGADETDEIEGEEGEEEPSPSVVRRAYDVDDDTF